MKSTLFRIGGENSESHQKHSISTNYISIVPGDNLKRVPWISRPCHGSADRAMDQQRVPWISRPCHGSAESAVDQQRVPWISRECSGSAEGAMDQQRVLRISRECHGPAESAVDQQRVLWISRECHGSDWQVSITQVDLPTILHARLMAAEATSDGLNR